MPEPENEKITGPRINAAARRCRDLQDRQKAEAARAEQAYNQRTAADRRSWQAETVRRGTPEWRESVRKKQEEEKEARLTRTQRGNNLPEGPRVTTVGTQTARQAAVSVWKAKD